jgi:hypothetical protein
VVGDSTSPSGSGDWTGIAGKGGMDAIILRYSSTGKVLEKKNFGGPGLDSFGSVTEVSGGVVAVGCADLSSFGRGDWTGIAGKGGIDAIIVKFNDDGEVVWKKNFGGTGNDYYTAVAAVSGGVVAAGWSASDSFGSGDWAGVRGRGDSDAIIVKFNDDGEVVWKKNFGGPGFDYYSAVAAVPGGFVAVGESSSDSFGNGDWAGVTGKGSVDATIVRYNDDGEVVWKKNFGGQSVDWFHSVTAVSDGIVAAGESLSGSSGNGDWAGVTGKGDNDAMIVRYNDDREVVWKKNFGGSGPDSFNSITAVSDGVVAAGYSGPRSFGNGDWAGVTGKGNNNAIIVKYNIDGEVVLKKNFGGSGSDHFLSVTAASGGVIAVGWSASDSFGNGDWEGTAGKGHYDATVVKYDISSGTGTRNGGPYIWLRAAAAAAMMSYVLLARRTDPGHR